MQTTDNVRPTRRISASTAIALHAVLLSVTGAWWLAHGGPWVQVAALGLPVAVAAIWTATQLVTVLGPALRSERLTASLRVSLVALSGAASIAMSAAVLGLLTGDKSSAELLSGAVRDTLLALPVGVVVTLAAGALLSVRLPGRARLRLTSRRTGFAVVGASLVFTGAGVLPRTVTPTADASSAADGPCPAGAPTKSFDVQAINVDIPYNRFGDHDPNGRMYVLSNRVADVREQEASQEVSIGLRDDPIQPLVIRANQGECVSITYTNNADGGDFGLHIDGLPFKSDASGDAVGRNAISNPAKGGSHTYRYWIPNDPTLEGAHYLHPGPGFRDVVNHGLFGSLVVEPPGSTYLDPNAPSEAQARPLESGWEAIIRPASNKEFRENVQLYHEVGNEDDRDAVLTRTGELLPVVDPHTDAYRPNTRAISYRSESFLNRLDNAEHQEAHAYGSYTFGDPATPIPRGYRADPTKFRILHAGAELFHVFHMHGGGIRWRFNPVADPTFDYAETGLEKFPVEQSGSERLDSQSFGPGESYNLEIEGGAGGVQQGAGDFLFHCHIAEHYVAGMWAFWRVYDTRQPEFAPLADRKAPAVPVESTALVGKKFGGQEITASNLDDWIRPQLPPQGVRNDAQDATVWDWATNPANPRQYLGEPEDTRAYPGYYNDPNQPGHPTALPVDRFVGNRPVLLFNPENGRPAFPMMRPHLGIRPPWAPAGHSGAPYLGEMSDQTARTDRPIDPWAEREDAICPQRGPNGQDTALRRFNVVAIEKSVQISPTQTDPTGMVYALAHDKNDILAGRKPVEPLAIRANAGDCVAVTLTSELTDANAAGNFSQVNMHIHHVQFDTQASDGVITGMSYEQAVRPYKVEDPQLTAAANAGATVLHLADVAKFHVGSAIGVGLGTEGPAATGTANPVSGRGPEVRTITAIDPVARTVTLDRALDANHPAGQWAGTEFTQYRWFVDADLDNIFWHDHVDGIHTWAHGLVGQLISEPRGSTYHDPRTGEEVDSGAIVDIHTNNPLADAAGVSGSFREMALWTMDKGFSKDNDSMLNLRAAPFSERTVVDPLTGVTVDPSLRFSSYKWGDPMTPLPRAYAGDPFVIRTINVGPTVDTFHVGGHDFLLENRYKDANNLIESGSTNTLHYGISEKFTLILRGGAGGTNKLPGDYLYFNGIERRLRDGAWGIIRVLEGRVPGSSPSDPDFLQPLPGASPVAGQAVPTMTGARPPEDGATRSPCPANAPIRSFDLTAIRRDTAPNATRYAYVPSSEAGRPDAGREPLAMHFAAGDCVKVQVTNLTKEDRIGFHLTGLAAATPASGVNVGFNPETTIADGASRTYTYWVDNPKFSGGAIGDLTGDELTKRGLYGVYTVAPKGSTFTDPVTGNRSDLGEAVNVSVPNGPDYRDFSLILSEDERQIGANFMPYPVEVERPEANLVNYRRAPRDDSRGDAFSSLVHGDPSTPILTSYAGDKVVVNVLGAPGSEQMHAFNLGGFSFSTDPGIHGANMVQTKGVGPWELFSAPIDGGAGGRTHEPGDYFYGDMRRVFTRAGMWGLQRVLPKPANCPTADGAALICLGDGTSVSEPPPVEPPKPAPRPVPTLRQRSRAWVGTAAVFTGTARPETDLTFWYDSARPGRPARRIAGTIADRNGDWRHPLRLRDSGYVWAVSRDGTSRKVLVNVYAQSALTAMSPARHRANFWVSSPAAPRGARFAVVVRNRAGVRVKTVRGIIGRRHTGVVRDVRIRSGWLVGTAVVRDPYHVEVRSTRHRFRVF